MPSHIPYTLIRSSRRTVSLSVTSTGLIVRAPMRTPINFIEKWLSEKEAWIQKTTEKVKNNPLPIKHSFTQGETFLFLGEPHQLIFKENIGKKVIFKDTALFVDIKYRTKTRKLLQEWYKDRAIEILSERTSLYAKEARLIYQSIKVTSASKRWGSCSVKGNINFTWRLVMAPLWVIDYVVAHELAHLKHHNHGKAFWAYVLTMHDKPKEARAWLKQNGSRLVL